ncbi:aldehyde dehydrogenase family protein [Brevibacterium sp. 50QC2O2]|uniref:aldehyde dehydrogenase family protein n=1 Tax=Brevibacterium sp. 50QC2O2 TaxID=2968459 RepID=UPI00211CC4D3|nr:aldehyde dehydrogenase family protein [Brevibacterium sp. 50QC2O2]MCQ9388588.1 aldehyde dehydrogenase family protein [Brevibacterium sp. 50QC2O2]
MPLLQSLQAGQPVPFGGDRFSTVSPELAAAFQPGDRLYVVQSTGNLLHVTADVHALVTDCVDQAAKAAAALRTTPAARVVKFYRVFAERLVEHWDAIASANAADVDRAQVLGRSTTRLRVDRRMREDMVAGLEAWADLVESQVEAGQSGLAGEELDFVDHGDWQVATVTAPLGVIGFVFEGRPNVFADSAGVLATGNAAVLRIGGDALHTAQAIVDHALAPALAESGLPAGALSLVPSRERSAGYALFSDRRVSLAVVRGSGRAVAELSSVAQQAGIPVSAHGTGGAWLYADLDADAERFAAVVCNSLDRKVCNTLNVAAVSRARAEELLPLLVQAADRAAAGLRPGARARIHVAAGSGAPLGLGSAPESTDTIDVVRAEGVVAEPRITVLPIDELGHEWEWEGTPELSVVVVEDMDEAVELFNAYSPQFVASLISESPEAHERFRAGVNAPFVGDGFTRWVDGQYALGETELGLSNWERGRLLGRSGVLTGGDLTARRIFAHHADPAQHR